MSEKTLGQIGYEALQALLWADYARTDWTHPAVDRARPAWETAMQVVAAHVASPDADGSGSAAEILTEHLAIRFPADMIAAAKQLATAEGMTVSAWIRREVEREAARREQPAPGTAAAMAETRELRQLVADILESYEATDDRGPATRVQIAKWRKRAGLDVSTRELAYAEDREADEIADGDGPADVSALRGHCPGCGCPDCCADACDGQDASGPVYGGGA